MAQATMQEKLNFAIQKIAAESGSEMVRNLVMVEQTPPRQADCVFTGVVDCWAWFHAAGAEVHHCTQPDRGDLDKLVKCRIQDSLLAVMDLAQSELKKLGVEVEIML